ncbi:winged helix DNA-binding domain-containing protein [bacterium]|nr:winged helix DNA-binding domain-containing protein [bacterium]
MARSSGIPHNSQKLSLDQARSLVLHSQRLTARKPFGTGVAATLSAVEHLGYVQIDTISVVERAHHHVLWSRVPDYTPRVLHQLQFEQKKIFEYWSHAAAFLPMRDYRFSLRRKNQYLSGRKHYRSKNKKVRELVLKRIQNEGPLQARDFEAPKRSKSGPWFEWKPAKVALEQLFLEGTLMVPERRGFQKVFDLTERVLSGVSEVNWSAPTEAEFAQHLIRNALRFQGFASLDEVSYLRQGVKSIVAKELRNLEEAGELQRIQIGGEKGSESYALSSLLEKISNESLDQVRILSPFDNFIIQRKRLRRLFDYDYVIECYVPEPKRKFGYFCLPILYGDRLVGRIDAKAERDQKLLIVKSAFFEKAASKLRKDQRFMTEFMQELEGFAEFNGCERVEARALG